jgi:hypothetical protein
MRGKGRMVCPCHELRELVCRLIKGAVNISDGFRVKNKQFVFT